MPSLTTLIPKKWITLFNNINNVLLPRVCFGCTTPLSRGEDVLCTVCRHEFPLTHYNFSEENAVDTIFYGRVPIQKAASFVFFTKRGIVQNLLHGLKYKNQEHIGSFFGAWCGAILENDIGLHTVEVVIPVPLHPKKEKKRGYNQSYHIALGIAEVMNVAVDKRSLRRVVYKGSQTQLSREKRWENVADNFKVKGASLTGKHVLLVDDVLTTGATIEACYNALKEVEGIRVSVATLARAQ